MEPESVSVQRQYPPVFAFLPGHVMSESLEPNEGYWLQAMQFASLTDRLRRIAMRMFLAGSGYLN